MTYASTTSLSLGTGQTGLILRAQLISYDGTSVGSAISSGFVEIGQGNYMWTYSSYPNGFRGVVKFYDSASPSVILAIAAINPEEIENIVSIKSAVNDLGQEKITNSQITGSSSITIRTGSTRRT